MYISLSFAVIQCNGNNNKFTHHHHSLICVRPHYFLTSHFVTRVPCCCCCCEWCDVAVDLQTDKTQSSDTWWARSAARECCLRPGPGGNTLTLTRVWSVCVHTQNAFEIKYFLQNCTSAIRLRCLGFIILFLFYFWLRCVYQAQCGPPGQWGWGDHMGHAPVWAGDQGVSHGAGLSVTQTGWSACQHQGQQCDVTWQGVSPCHDRSISRAGALASSLARGVSLIINAFCQETLLWGYWLQSCILT